MRPGITASRIFATTSRFFCKIKWADQQRYVVVSPLGQSHGSLLRRIVRLVLAFFSLSVNHYSSEAEHDDGSHYHQVADHQRNDIYNVNYITQQSTSFISCRVALIIAYILITKKSPREKGSFILKKFIQ